MLGPVYHDRGDLLGDRAPLGGVPTLGAGLQRAIEADEHERGQLGQAERANEGAIRIAVHEEPFGQRAEEGPGSFRIGGDHEVDACVGATERLEDACRGLEHPRALVGVGIEDHAGQVECGQPLFEGACLATQ